MKKSMIKSLALLLAFILAFSALTIGASAAPAAPSNDDILFKAQEEATKEVPDFAAAAVQSDFTGATVVTGDFTATTPWLRAAFYKFVPATSGYYSINSTADKNKCDPAIYLYNSSREALKYADDTIDSQNFDMIYYLTAGAAYYFEIFEYAGRAVSFGVKIAFLGELTAEVTSYPDKNAYILDYETGVYQTLVGGEEYYINLEFDGFEVKLTFGSGRTVTLKDWDVWSYFGFLDVEYDKPTAVGTHEIRFKIGDMTAFVWYVDLIANPVSSIEILRLPTKTEYVYKLDGWYFRVLFNVYFFPYIDATGMRLKINYTDGTSEIVEPNGENGVEYKGYWIDYGSVFGCTLGENDIEVSYLGKTATFKVNIVKPTLYQGFLMGLMKIAEFLSDISWFKDSIWDGVWSWLNDLAHAA